MKTKIFIDSGAWFIAYIFTHYDRDIFSEVYFQGVSTGRQSCGYILASIHGNKDLKYWLENGPIITQFIEYSKITKYYSCLSTNAHGESFVCDKIENQEMQWHLPESMEL